MQPALRLVTKILLSDPPFWRAITNMYHMRPVDADRLPLTEEQRRNSKLKLHFVNSMLQCLMKNCQTD